MPNINEKEVEDIKAGVEGFLSDVPEPSGEIVPETSQETSGETTYAESSYSTYNTPTQDFNNAPQGSDTERIHEIIEAIINERWDELLARVGNLVVWKEKITNDIISTKQEVVRIEENLRQLQNAVLGKVRDYDQGIRDVYTEMKALEKVFEKILEPLSSNIKELTRITQELKKVK